MKLAFGQIHGQPDPEKLVFARQLGLDTVIVHTPLLPGDGFYEYDALVKMRTTIEGYGLRLEGIECMPFSYYDKAVRGEPGRDEQIEKFCKTVTNMGRAGIHKLVYIWIALGTVHRTSHAPTGRGGAHVTAYDHRHMENAPLSELAPITDEQLWDSLEYFLKAVIPVAEAAGVTLGLHPDDPPVPEIAGVARIIRSVDAYKRVINIVDSPSNGLEFCQGCITEMCEDPEDVYDAIRYFASRDKIIWVHFRNVHGTVPVFAETFIDNGDVDMMKAMRAYQEVGYDSYFIVDHTPRMIGDSAWGFRGRAYAMGYMRGLVHYLKSVYG